MYRDVLALMVSKSLVDWNLLGECPSHCWRTQRDLAKSMDTPAHCSAILSATLICLAPEFPTQAIGSTVADAPCLS